MKHLLDYLKPYRRESILAPLFKMLEAIFELFVPLVVAAIIDRGIGAGDRALVVRGGLGMVALAVIGMVSSITAQYFAAKAAVGFSTGVRRAVFAHIQGLSYEGLDRIGTSTLITRMTSDVQQVQTGVNLTLRLFLRSPFIVFGAMVMAMTIDLRAAGIFAATIALLAVVVFGIMAITIPLYKKVQTGLDRVLAHTRENLVGARVIRAFGMEDAQVEEFDGRNRALTDAQQFVGRISALLNPVTYVIVNGALIALIWTGAVTVDGGLITQGAVIALVNYLMQILVELIKLANLIVTMTRAMACWGRIEGVLDAPTGEASGDRPLDPGALSIRFDDVSMRYPGAGADALGGISFAIEGGQTLGVIGGTGSGKSTLVNLIARFYDVTGGCVEVGGSDVRALSLAELRGAIGVVPQKAELFAGTIASNLRWGNDEASDEALRQALETAQAWDFVRQKPGGLAATVEQRGRNLSGGQRQRLTIARALVKKPRILILDDSASALDYMTDARLRRSIADMPGAPTVVIVSQRAASVMHLDQIVVLDDGKLAGVGTHEALLKDCAVYREIYHSQFSGEAMG